MAAGNTWSTGHGSEYEILRSALKSADKAKIDGFRAALENGDPIMNARAIIHEGLGRLVRRTALGVALPDWDPKVTQARWYDEDAGFWLDAKSTPRQIESIMRFALEKCCDLWVEGYLDFQFAARCEYPTCRIEYGVPRGKDQIVTFWVYIPDHWGSNDKAGGDGESRPLELFRKTAPGAGRVGENAVGSKSGDAEPDPGPGSGLLGGRDGVTMTTIHIPGDEDSWAADKAAKPVPKAQQAAGAPNPVVLPQVEALRRAMIGPSDNPGNPISGGPGQHGGSPIPTTTPAATDSQRGLYGRLFDPVGTPNGVELDRSFDSCQRLARTMIQPLETPELGKPDEDENRHIDAFYTYLGQFIDHDLTFDPSSSLQRLADPTFTVDFRTPRLDLDSLYGRGPRDQPYLYDGDKFRLGRNLSTAHGYRPDLPRLGDTRVALIGDPRNDQQVLISQLTVLFLRFHNALVSADPNRTFEQVQQLVRWHYQWLIVHDYLPTIVGEQKMAQYLANIDPTASTEEQLTALRNRLRIPSIQGTGGPFMPVEFSAAAFRFGHAMVRPAYAINGTNKAPIPILAEVGDNLAQPKGGDNRYVDWSFLLGDTTSKQQKSGLPQRSYRIGPRLVDPLGQLANVGLLLAGDQPSSLPERTLRRGVLLRLPSGQTVARALQAAGCRDIRTLEPIEIDGGLDLDEAITRHTPLWYYILREADLARGGEHLGPLGATLVAEVLLSMLINDPSSYLHQPTWRPSAVAGKDGFTAQNLVAVAESWKP